jgi:hypothetical protein
VVTRAQGGGGGERREDIGGCRGAVDRQEELPLILDVTEG